MSPVENTPPSEPAEAPPEQIQRLFGQSILLGAIALLLLSVSYTYFVWTQNNHNRLHLNELSEQLKQADGIEQMATSLVSDLQAYAQTHGEVQQILMRYGLVTPPAVQSQNPGTLPLPPGR
ncbi:MAG: hypothetical protein JO317_00015 [Verrucomicrobiae bacterium]|nr:hypothetical protein [Verrucomicrobiae bacterium]